MTALFESTATEAADHSPSLPTDAVLMEMVQAHRHSGLALLHGRHAALLKAVSMNVLHNDADADDLIQEVFCEIWNRAAMFDPAKGSASAWIATLTRRRSIDRLRKRETYARFEERFIEETRTQRDCWTNVHEDLAHGERKKHLRRALSALPELQRNAIHLAYFGEMSQREIAAHTGIALGTIKTRLELGLKKMACFLRRFEDLLGAGRRSESADINVSRDTARQAASPIMS